MVNSDPLHARAWEELLKEHGHEFAALPEDFRAGFVGMRIIDILGKLIDYLQLKANKDDLYKKRTELFLEIVRNELEPMPGLLGSLKRFKAANYRLAVASSGANAYIDLVLNKFGIRDYFEVIVTGDDVKIGKPHPEAYLAAIKKLKLAPAECLVLEDATKGIQSAKAAGCKCIAIKNPNIPAQDFGKADLVVQDLNHITLKIVRSLGQT
jgi:HAD superfamily hydrolase (TIGR01509 family)